MASNLREGGRRCSEDRGARGRNLALATLHHRLRSETPHHGRVEVQVLIVQIKLLDPGSGIFFFFFCLLSSLRRIPMASVALRG